MIAGGCQMIRHLFLVVLLTGLLGSLVFAAQKGHRLDPQSREAPNEFDRMQKQGTASDPRARAALEQQRKADLDQLQRELPRLISLAQDLQDRMKSLDPNAVLPADLRTETKQLEELAHKIQKRIGNL
jgi:hypothetical protein